MIPSISKLLLEGKGSVASALEARLEALAVYPNSSEKTLLEKQTEEIRKERTFINNQTVLSALQALVDNEADAEEFQKKAKEILETEYQRSVNSEEFFRFVIKFGLSN
ncbi:hypothetical protein NEMIN01_0712 [Nematocida minor]|uniref:uncharacterized protein n=1 Tax=Nematocida minor TaxID=1912983 RepID=UPI00222113F4|nr:uncharacterized protein NEMIN01_0712 [Nematocida minor]KAI5189849.1 hypothetical protein NEMIN01_0712 [Nematocida minor]